MNPLAMSLGVDSVYAVPSELTEPQMVASLLAPVLRVDADDLRDRFQTGAFLLLGQAARDPGRSRPRP